MEHGFFEMSEFATPSGKHNFMLEQISQVGKVRINIFDKATGDPLAMMCDNLFKDENEQHLFDLRYADDVQPERLKNLKIRLQPGDFIGITPEGKVATVMVNLPKSGSRQPGFLSKVSSWAKSMGDAPKDVLEIHLPGNSAHPIRPLCALGVIAHARRGLQLPTMWQDAVRKSG